MKIPAEFAPKSWEMPPSARVIEESASVVARDFDGETLNWLVALVEIPSYKDPILWTRALDVRFDAGFIALEFPYYRAMPIPSSVARIALKSALTSVWQSGRFARQFFLNDKGKLRRKNENASEAILIALDGKAAWSLETVHEKGYDTTIFQWNKPTLNSEFFRLSSHEVWKKLRRLLSNPKSEALFARQFALMNEEERKKSFFDETSGTNKEIENLLSDLLIADETWRELQEGEPINVCIPPRFSSYIQHQKVRLYLPMSVQEMVTEIQNRFRPIKKDVISRFCVEDWLRRNPIDINITIPYPTAHEQLEAQLRWREWKRNHEKI